MICAAMAISAISCNEKIPQEGGAEEPASLSINLLPPQASISLTRSISFPDGGGKLAADPFSDPSEWTAWERAIDGQGLYRVTLFLLERDTHNLVGYRDIYYKSEDVDDLNGWWDGEKVQKDEKYGRQVALTFNYDNPLHKSSSSGESIERLHRGPYRMVIVANWSAIGPEDLKPWPENIAEYGGLGSDRQNNFKTYVDQIIDKFMDNIDNKALAFDDENNYPYMEFGDWVLRSSDHFVCYPIPQPLVLVQDITLQPGMNRIEGQLRRCYSRIRVTVENLSSKELTVNSLEFCETFTKNATYLFDDPSLPNRCYNIERLNNVIKELQEAGEDIPTAVKGAVQPTFSYSLVQYPVDEQDKPDKVIIQGVGSGDNSKTIFDGYILENRDEENPLEYTIDLEYAGETRNTYVLSDPTDGICSTDKLKDGGMYAIKCQHSATGMRFLTAGTNTVETFSYPDIDASSLPRELDHTLVWQLESVSEGSDRYYIKAVGDTPYYIGNPNGYTNNIILTAENEVSFTLSSDGSYIAMKSDTDPNQYIDINGNDYSNVGGYATIGQGSKFTLYEIDCESTTPGYSSPITLSTIDPVTSEVSPVNTIARNDFINILITVSYNPDTGDFMFKVKDWNKVEGDIEFN